jgi:hypothetical protein
MQKILPLFLAAISIMFVGAAQTHDLQGLLDTSGKVIIPFRYQKIQYLDKGIYRCFSSFHRREWRPRGASNVQSAKKSGGYYNPYLETAELVDKNGQAIDIAPPAGCLITAVHVPRELLNPLIGRKAKPNVFFTIHGKDGYGLIDWTGKVVVPPEYDSISLRTAIYCKSWRSAIVSKKSNPTSEIPLETAIDENTGVDTQIKYSNPRAGYSLVKNDDRTELFFNGKQLLELPPGYTNFELVKDSRVLAIQTLDSEAPLAPPIMMDRLGKELNKLPVRARVVKITESGLIVDQLPETTKGVPCGGRLHFLDFDGNVLKIIPIQTSPPDFKLGFAVLPGYTSDQHCDHSGIREDGVVLMSPQFCDFEVTEKNRVIKTEFQSKFDSEECKADERSLGEQFQLFRKDYKNLIGMPRKKLEDLVGNPGSGNSNIMSRYQLSGFGSFCGNAYSFVEFKFKNNVIVGWRCINNNDPIDPDHEKPWLEKNEVSR